MLEEKESFLEMGLGLMGGDWGGIYVYTWAAAV